MDGTCSKHAEERNENSLTASHTWEHKVKKLEEAEEEIHVWTWMATGARDF